jgi:hypothetical protein
MKTLRLLTTIVGIITTLAIIATPASASFEANGNTSQGPYTINGPSIFTNTVKVECATLERGEWHLRKIETSQELTKHGHQEITGQYTKCIAEVGGIKSNAKINSTCALEVEATQTKGDVRSNCSVTRGPCIITIAAGAPNTELTEIKSVSIAAGNEETSNVKGVTSTVNKSCEELGVTGNKEGTFKGTGVATGAKLV